LSNENSAELTSLWFTSQPTRPEKGCEKISATEISGSDEITSIEQLGSALGVRDDDASFERSLGID
jgi:hypothetical protein